VKQTRDTHKIVWVTQDMPNTQLSLIIVKQLQYEHYWLGLQLGKSHTTHLTSPRHSYTDSSHQDSLSQPLSQPLWCTPDMHPTTDLLVSSLSQDFTKLTQTLVLPHSMPHTDLRSDFPKLSLCIPLLATCLPCLRNSALVFPCLRTLPIG
jgi:hypothetical protein